MVKQIELFEDPITDESFEDFILRSEELLREAEDHILAGEEELLKDIAEEYKMLSDHIQQYLEAKAK